MSATRNFTLKVQNTKPHCIEEPQIICLDESGFKVQFKPGYDGGHQQEFRLFYKDIPDSKNPSKNWKSTDKFKDFSIDIFDLERFSKYQFFIEASNEIGSINCTLKDQYSKDFIYGLRLKSTLIKIAFFHLKYKLYFFLACSTLNPPENLHISEDTLEWSSVEEAKAYRVSYRKSQDESFKFYVS